MGSISEMDSKTIELLRAAYLAGFNRTGEGWNAEWPFGHEKRNPEDDANWRERRDEDIMALIARG